MDNDHFSRRHFLAMGGSIISAAFASHAWAKAFKLARSYQLALSTTSLVNSIGEEGGRISLLDVPRLVRDEFDLRAALLLNTQFERMDVEYVGQVHKALQKAQVELPVVLVQDVGNLGGGDVPVRATALSNYKSWVDRVVQLDCKVMRIQWKGHERTTLRNPDELEAFINRSVMVMQQLCEYAAERGVTILIETLGGPSSDPASLLKLLELVKAENLGVMPNFGKFLRGTDLVENLTQLAPVSQMYMSSSRDFDELTGKSLDTDFEQAIILVHDTLGYQGVIGIEYTGTHYTEYDGVKRAKERLMALMQG